MKIHSLVLQTELTENCEKETTQIHIQILFNDKKNLQ